jgi:hypothetical protein
MHATNQSMLYAGGRNISRDKRTNSVRFGSQKKRKKKKKSNQEEAELVKVD